MCRLALVLILAGTLSGCEKPKVGMILPVLFLTATSSAASS